MSVTYGLVKWKGPYAQNYPQEHTPNNYFRVDPWNQLVLTGVVEPSKYAKGKVTPRMVYSELNPPSSYAKGQVTARTVPSSYWYRRFRPYRRESVAKPGDVAALFGATTELQNIGTQTDPTQTQAVESQTEPTQTEAVETQNEPVQTANVGIQTPSERIWTMLGLPGHGRGPTPVVGTQTSPPTVDEILADTDYH